MVGSHERHVCGHSSEDAVSDENRAEPADEQPKSRSQIRLEQFSARLADAVAARDFEPILDGYPLRLSTTFYDGPGAVLVDRHGKPRSAGLIYDEEQAAQLLETLNKLAEMARVS